VRGDIRKLREEREEDIGRAMITGWGARLLWYSLGTRRVLEWQSADDEDEPEGKS